MKIHKCDICAFETENGRVMSNHKRWKHLNISFSEEARNTRTKKIKPKIKRICICPKCNLTFEKVLSKSNWNKIDKNQNGLIWCSKKCSNSRNWTEEKREKLSLTLKTSEKARIVNFHRRVDNRAGICPVCNKSFIKRDKYCSIDCYSIARKRIKKDIIDYRQKCAFKFSINDFPEKFDLDIVKEYGWYKAKNRGNNLNGVSRDHMVSIKFGFENNVDPWIISHPANCKLIRHNENITKNSKCSISLSDLVRRILDW